MLGGQANGSTTGVAENQSLLVKALSMEVWPWWAHVEPLLQPLCPFYFNGQHRIKGPGALVLVECMGVGIHAHSCGSNLPSSQLTQTEEDPPGGARSRLWC